MGHMVLATERNIWRQRRERREAAPEWRVITAHSEHPATRFVPLTALSLALSLALCLALCAWPCVALAGVV